MNEEFISNDIYSRSTLSRKLLNCFTIFRAWEFPSSSCDNSIYLAVAYFQCSILCIFILAAKHIYSDTICHTSDYTYGICRHRKTDPIRSNRSASSVYV